MISGTDRARLRELAVGRYWSEVDGRAALAAFEASGLTRAAFRRETGISTQRLKSWRRRLGATAEPAGKIEFVPVEVTPRAAATRQVIGEDPLCGHVVVFLNRRGDRVKLLLWDRNGWLLVYKRLERGVFRRPREAGAGAGHVLLEGPELARMLEGIDLRGARRRPRWEPQPSAR